MPKNSPDAAIDVSALTVSRGDVVALDDVSLTVAPGRVCALVGMNGSGKSTLLAAVLGEIVPDSGSITVLGGTPTEARRRSLISAVPQTAEVDRRFPLSVDDVVMMGRYGRQGIARGIRPLDRAAVDAALERVELSALRDRQIGKLSGGQSKRAFLARALAQEAEILLLDEPFAGVDQSSQATIVPLVRALAAEGKTVLVATHDLQGLPELADEVVLLRQGHLLAHGPTDEVLALPSRSLSEPEARRNAASTLRFLSVLRLDPATPVLAQQPRRETKDAQHSGRKGE